MYHKILCKKTPVWQQMTMTILIIGCQQTQNISVEKKKKKKKDNHAVS